MIGEYEVIVGNIGTVYFGSNRELAEESYQVYAGLAESERGRTSGESVIFFVDGVAEKEVDPSEILED